MLRSSGLFSLVLAVHVGCQGTAYGPISRRDVPRLKAPGAASAREKLVKDLGPVGRLMLRTARGGLDRLPQAERSRLVAELDRFHLVVHEQVEPKALASDGSVVAWRFSSQDLPEAKLRPDASNDVTKSLDVRPAQVIVRRRPPDESDVNQA